MQRGDLVTVSLQGDYGKPRPALGHLEIPIFFLMLASTQCGPLCLA